jgi:outer membrane protein
MYALLLSRITACALAACFLLQPFGAQAGQTYSLKAAVETALERNFTVRAAEERYRGAQAATQSRRGTFGPVLGTRYDYDRRQHEVASGGRAQDKELFTWRVYLRQSVFAGFATLADYQQAILREDNAEQGVRQARLELIRIVQENFFIYLKAKQDVVSARDALERLQSQLASSRAFYDVGVSPRIDVLQAEVDVSAAESALLVAENVVASQKARLNTLLLLPLEADVEYAGELGHIPFSRSLDDCLHQAYRLRPDLIMAEKSVRIAEKDITRARSAFYPHLAAHGAWGTTGNSALAAGSPNTKPHYSEWTMGMTAEWQIFEWGRALHDLRRAGHEKSRVQAEADNLRQEVGFMVKVGMLAMDEAAKRINVAQKGVDQAAEAYRMADARYRQQVGTMTQVLDAQAKLSLAEAALAEARSDYGIALSSLYVAIGEENSNLGAR